METKYLRKKEGNLPHIAKYGNCQEFEDMQKHIRGQMIELFKMIYCVPENDRKNSQDIYIIALSGDADEHGYGTILFFPLTPFNSQHEYFRKVFEGAERR